MGWAFVGLGALSCACRPRGATRPGGEASAPQVQVEGVEPAYRDAWDRVLRAIDEDPTSARVDQAADELLALDPPLELQIGALTAKAQRSYRSGDDPRAIRLLEDARRRMLSDPSPDHGVSSGLRRDLWRALLFALARGGDPQRALDLLDEMEARGSLSVEELWGVEAVAFERSGNLASATLAFAEWRAHVADDSADAGYAESRFAALASQLELSNLQRLRELAESPAAAACLRVRAGEEAGADAPNWVERCRELPARVGVLLPRSGKYSVFADTHFAAATASIRVLSRERGVAVLWRDSESTANGAKNGALELVREGAEVLIGPIARAHISGVVDSVGPRVRVVVPGEPATGADGVSPSLAQRLRVLVNAAAARKRNQVILFAPDNAYGKLVVSSLKDAGVSGAVTTTVLYPTSTTSFHDFVKGARASLRQGMAILIADSFPRTEMLVRQLRRDGYDPASSGRRAPVLLLTAEGWSPELIAGEHAVFDKALMAPIAAASDDSREFEREFTLQQGQAPDAQALLVWEAFARVWRSEGRGQKPSVRLLRVQHDAVETVEVQP